MEFKKAIVWGCRLHQHTNSYVYAAFHKAFQAMGFEAYLLYPNSDVSGMDFANTLFLTEGQHDANIPLRNDCKYILHNCCSPKYGDIRPENKLALQVYTDDAPFKWHAEKIGGGAYYLKDGRCLFQPWATDLLPAEINLDWANIPRTKEVHWVGTIGPGEFGNINEIETFKTRAASKGVGFHYHPPGSSSFEENKGLVQASYVAPAIHGTWQAKQGYIACRVFKNISYGQAGATNSKAAWELFDGAIAYSADTAELFDEAERAASDRKSIRDMMRIVQEKHTYINRIERILSVI